VTWWVWLLVWLVLAAGTVVGAVFLVRSLWHKAVALADALGGLEDLAERLDVVTDLPSAVWVHPLTATDADTDRWRAGIAGRREERGARRAARHQAAYARWDRWWR